MSKHNNDESCHMTVLENHIRLGTMMERHVMMLLMMEIVHEIDAAQCPTPLVRIFKNLKCVKL